MSKSFFFYDLETSGLNPRDSRIMQFAGIRTDEDLQQIGGSYNLLVKLSDDTLPSPDAVMVTGITPQKTIEEGYSEAEFAKILTEEIFTADTIVVGFNNIRFDDEFVRHLFWRNFFDPYEWTWRDGRSRWDMLDVVRMTRALRPEGIKWPVDDEGKATNRLELITKVNKLDHFKAHDALSDVEALIAVTRLIRDKQPQLFEYLYKIRYKNEIKRLVNLDNKQPFVYSSGRYEVEYNKTTVAFPLTSGRNSNVVVYDLRYDPTLFIKMSSNELAKKLFANYEERQKEDFVKIPIKELQYNRAPAVAPVGVLSQSDGWNKISLDETTITKNRDILLSSPSFAENIRTIFESRDKYPKSQNPEARLYDSFIPDVDKVRIEAVRNASANELADFHPNFNDERLEPLLMHYKARNYPNSLSADEAEAWEKWRTEKINSELPEYMNSIGRLLSTNKDENRAYILQELQLWAESIAPSDY